MKNDVLQRVLSTILCLLLLCAFAVTAGADTPLRAYCYNLGVNTDSAGMPTGLRFTCGAQFGTAPYTYTYALVGPVNMSGTLSGSGTFSLSGTFSAGAYSLTVQATDAVGATSSAALLFALIEDEAHHLWASTSSSVAPLALEAIKVSEITLNQTTLSLRTGESAMLTATVLPANASNKTLTWDASDISVATVDQTGLVTALKAGNCKITCTASDGSGVSSAVILIVIQPVTGISLSPASLTLPLGGSTKLAPVVMPTTAANREVTYASSNPAVVAVSSDGTVIGVSEGVATVTVISKEDATKRAACTITVGVPVTGVSVSLTSAGLETGKSLALGATVSPANATNPGLLWTSSDPAIVTVSSNGVITAWKAGTATITAAAVDGSGKTGKCIVYVTGTEVPKPTASPTIAPTAQPTAAPTTQPGSPAGQLAYVHTQQGGLNLRASASQSASRLTIIPENAAFTVITYGKTWCYAWYNGYYGYVMTKYVRLANATPTPTVPSVTKTPAPDAPVGQTAFVNTEKGGLNLRKAASQSATRLTIIPENATFTVITYGTKWCYAWYNGYYGYVMTQYVGLAGETALPTAQPVTPTPTPLTTPTPTPTPAGNAYVNTVSGGLNLRVSASQSATRIAIIPRGSYINVTTRGATWSQVLYNGRLGYVMTKYLVFVSDVVNTEPDVQYARVVTPSGGLNLRTGMGSEYSRIVLIPQGAYVQLIYQDKGWAQVKYDGYTGYVMVEYLQIV